MRTTPFDRIAGYYDRLVAKHGHDPRACDYGGPQSQQRKFEVLAEVTDLTDCAVLDVGCGFADWADFVRARFERVRYTGIDVSPEMVAAASELHPDLDLRLCNILDLPAEEQFDV